MMKNKLLFGLLLGLLMGCDPGQTKTSIENKVNVDTIVCRKIITEGVDPLNRKQVIDYFITIGKDTSDNTYTFFKSADSGKINLSLNIPYSKNNVLYRERINELKMILKKASKDINLDSLEYIHLGRLIQNGDLAIEITKQYVQKYKTNSKLLSNAEMKAFFMQSKLGRDITEVFKPYSLQVKDVSLEKLFFIPKKDLYTRSKIETDSVNIPDQIIDAMTWVELGME